MPAKPGIVFAHGLWADGSCFSKVIQPLQAEGYEVIASQHGLDSLASDVACARRTLGRVSSPAILVGHSYGGTLITAAGADDRVVGLVYIAALAPDETETSQSQPDKFPKTDVFKYIEVASAGFYCGQRTATASRDRRLPAPRLLPSATGSSLPATALPSCSASATRRWW